MRESAYQKIIRDEFRSLGAVVLNKLGTMHEGPGWPDLYVAHKIWTGWIELKTGSKLSTVQAQRIDQLRQCGVNVVVLRGSYITPGKRLIEKLEYCQAEGEVFEYPVGGMKPQPERGLARLKWLKRISEGGMA